MLPTLLRRIPPRSPASLLSRRAASTSVSVSQLSPNLKVAAVEDGSYTSSLSVILKAGSRYETAAGVANVLKNSAFKANRLTTALGTVRAAEHAGGVLSASLTREHLALTAEFLKGEEPTFMNLLAASLVPRLLSYEMKENTIPTAAMESAHANSIPSVAALEAAHALTFRNGLGNSIFTSRDEPVSVVQLQAFWNQVISGEIAIVGTGMSQESLENLVKHVMAGVIQEDTKGTADSTGEQYESAIAERIESALKNPIPSAQTAALSEVSYESELVNLKAYPHPETLPKIQSAASKTFGGEVRIPIDLHLLPEIQPTLLIAYGSTSQSSTAEHVLLPYVLGVDASEASLKWSSHSSPLASAAAVAGEGSSAQAYNQAYSDANLLCVEIAAEGTKRLSEAGKEVVKTLKGLKVSEEQLKRAVGQAKLALAKKWETSEGVREILAKDVFSGKIPSIEESFKALDKVSTDSINKVLSDLLKSKPSVVSVARLGQMAHSDELGL